MYKGFYGYQSGNVETKYTIEYIDDEKTWEKFIESDKIDRSCEPWELFNIKEYDNIKEAIGFFTSKATHKDTYFLQLTESIYYNGTLILENPLEVPDGFYACIARNINEDMREKLTGLSNRYEKLKELVEYYNAFVEKYHAEEAFKEYLKSQEV